MSLTHMRALHTRSSTLTTTNKLTMRDEGSQETPDCAGGARKHSMDDKARSVPNYLHPSTNRLTGSAPLVYLDHLARRGRKRIAAVRRSHWLDEQDVCLLPGPWPVANALRDDIQLARL